MSQTDSSIQKRVEEHISQNGGSIRNKAALGALVKLIPSLGDGLHHALTAGDEAIADEYAKVQLDLLCELAQKIDAAISELISEANRRGVPFTEISGTINVSGEDTANVTGLDASSGREVTIKPGTVINVDGKNAANITGVKL